MGVYKTNWNKFLKKWRQYHNVLLCERVWSDGVSGRVFYLRCESLSVTIF